MLWIRGAIFTALVPWLVAAWVPSLVDPVRHLQGGPWNAGWLLVAAGAAIYLLCLLRFLAAGGTPAIFFTRPLRAILGEEPPTLVQGWLYRLSRNPMYVGVVLSVFGQAIMFASRDIAVYGALLWLMFHIVVVVLEEPHLREQYGPSYEDYCRRVPRWLWIPTGHVTKSAAGIVMIVPLFGPPRIATPIEPAVGIADALRTHQVVAVTAGHGDARGYALGLALVRDPRVNAVVNDVVIEEGSARYQDVADRYVRGDEVPPDMLHAVWRETTQPGFGLDAPWESFFRAVRDINASRPRERQLRVLLGDPPIEWEHVQTAADHRKWIEMRDWYPADLIEREVIAKNRHALMLYGQMHFQRKQIAANYESQGDAETIISRLEEKWHATTLTIFSAGTALMKGHPEVGSWPVPSLALIRGTTLGAEDFTFYYSSEAMGRFELRDGKADFSSPVPRERWKTLRAEDQFDAVLYTGEEAPIPVRPSVERCADKDDIAERVRRAMLGPRPVLEQIKMLCGLP
jgi:protein-S-isoprenylcysteine O-methyltransferase Ste14